MGGVVFSPCNLAWDWTVVVVMTTSSKRTYASQICLPGLLLSVSLTLQQGLCWPSPPLETPKHSKAELAQFLVMATFPFPVLWCTQGSVCALQASLAGMRLDFTPNCDPHASFSVSSPFLLHVGYLFLVGSNIPVNSCSAASCDVGVLAGEDEHTSFYTAIFEPALCNLMKLWVMPCRATQDGQVIVESSDKTWYTGEGNSKPLQHSCLENSMNSMKRPKDITLNDETSPHPRLVSVQYATGEKWGNSYRRIEEAEVKWNRCPVVAVSGDESEVQCFKEQYCITAWKVWLINQAKVKVVRQERARLNIDILAFSELKWMGMGEFILAGSYIYNCGQESFRRSGVAS